jgi:adenosine deaminase
MYSFCILFFAGKSNDERLKLESRQNSLSEQNLREIPKVELHRHLEGALRFSTLIELAQIAGQDVPTDLAQQKKHFLVMDPMKDLKTVLRKFMATQAVLNSEVVLTRITFEAIEDACKEGIKILELRYAPTFIRQNHEHLSFEQIHRAVLKGIAQASNLPIAVGLLCTFQRTLSVAESLKVLDFVIDTKETWAGVDLADNEQDFPAKDFAKLFSKVHKHQIPITIHAGEPNTSTSAQNVEDAIDILGARRIGHGLQIIQDPRILKKVAEKKIPLELCPTSNWLTNGISHVKAHPFRKLMEAGVLTTINSDDPGIFDINLVNEYKLLSDHYEFTLKEFGICNDIAASASFLPLAEKQKHWPRKIMPLN